jgi:hypothetical protein
MPQPYNRNQLRALQATLDQRWPKLPPDDAEKWLRRVKEGRSPYSRVRVHAIRLPVDCIIALALHLGLLRGQIFRLTVNDMHYDNAGAVLRDSSGSLDNAWEAPFTTVAWEASRDWLVCRYSGQSTTRRG